jgi:hypothetical protein
MPNQQHTRHALRTHFQAIDTGYQVAQQINCWSLLAGLHQQKYTALHYPSPHNTIRLITTQGQFKVK